MAHLPKGPAEGLLTTPDGRLLEGLITNFFVVVSACAYTLLQWCSALAVRGSLTLAAPASGSETWHAQAQATAVHSCKLPAKPTGCLAASCALVYCQHARSSPYLVRSERRLLVSDKHGRRLF